MNRRGSFTVMTRRGLRRSANYAAVVVIAAALAGLVAAVTLALLAQSPTKTAIRTMDPSNAPGTLNDWVLSSSAWETYAAQHASPQAAASSTASGTTTRPSPQTVSNGPLSERLFTDVTARNFLPPSAALMSKTDISRGDGVTIAQLLYQLPNGQQVVIVRQQLPQPIPLSAITLDNAADTVNTLPSGTVIVFVHHAEPLTSQVVVVSAVGVMTNISVSNPPAPLPAAGASPQTGPTTNVPWLAEAAHVFTG